MKKIKYLLSLLIVVIGLGCEDDDVIVFNGDPLNKSNIINLEATIATNSTLAGEGDRISFSVTLPQQFDSDVNVSVRARFDNGRTTIGTATVAAGSTTGTGSVILPGSDGFDSNLLFGLQDFAKLEVVGIQLENLVEDTTYTISSNVVTVSIIDNTLSVAGGLNIILDWENPPAVNLNLFVLDESDATLESSTSTSRFESDLFQNAGRPDGTYYVYVVVADNGTADVNANIDYVLALTLPTGFVDIYSGTLIDAMDAESVLIATFIKTTNAETGVVSYTTMSE